MPDLPEMLIRIDERQQEILRRLASQDLRLAAMDNRIKTIEGFVMRWRWASTALIGLGAVLAWIVSILAPFAKKWIG